MATKTTYYIIGASALLLLLTMKTNKLLAAIANPFKIRGSDPFGSGAYGASRGDRKHEGVDIVTIPGQDIFSPITGKVVRIAYPYGNDLNYKGLLIENTNYEVKIFYIAPVANIVGTHVMAGQKVAIAQNISAKHGAAMINHAHIEVRNKKTKLLINPTNLFKL